MALTVQQNGIFIVLANVFLKSSSFFFSSFKRLNSILSSGFRSPRLPKPQMGESPLTHLLKYVGKSNCFKVLASYVSFWREEMPVLGFSNADNKFWPVGFATFGPPAEDYATIPPLERNPNLQFKIIRQNQFYNIFVIKTGKFCWGSIVLIFSPKMRLKCS